MLVSSAAIRSALTGPAFSFRASATSAIEASVSWAFGTGSSGCSQQQKTVAPKKLAEQV